MSHCPLFALFCFVVGSLTGCGSSSPAASGPKALFDQHCARCHAQAGKEGGPKIGSSKGPNLSKIGAEPGRTADYLTEFIRDPKSKKSDTKGMPGFADTLSDTEIRSLAEYLAAMK